MNRRRAEGGVAKYLCLLVGVALLAWLSLGAGVLGAGATAATEPRAFCDAYDQTARTRVEPRRDVSIDGEMSHRPVGKASLSAARLGDHKIASPDPRIATKEVPFGEIGPAHNPGAFPGLSTSTSKLQHTFKHAEDFGVTGNWNKTSGQALQDALDAHISA